VDEADFSAERMQRELDHLLRLRSASGPTATGRCLSCGAPLREPLRWCDTDCRDDWERAHGHRRA